MTKKKPLVIVTRRLPDVIETRLMELFDTRLNADDHPFSEAELVEAVRNAEILLPTVTDHINKTVLAAAGPQMKLIASLGTGGLPMGEVTSATHAVMDGVGSGPACFNLLHNPATRASYQNLALRGGRLLGQPLGFRYALGLVLSCEYGLFVMVNLHAPRALLMIAKHMEEFDGAVVNVNHGLNHGRREVDIVVKH